MAPNRNALATELVSGVLAGDRRLCARAISLIENNAPEAREIVSALYPHTGQAMVVGVTGSPGVGKSTLVEAMTLEWRRRGRTVGIVAVDPTSPFTGGAILGDRIRMQRTSGDVGVFIRSMAARGHLGGLAAATEEAVAVLDAAGFQVVIVETVGAGQSEVEVMNVARTTVVVLAPGLGDDVQAAKAGILEIGDVFVVNKADRPGAKETAVQLENMLELGGAMARHGRVRLSAQDLIHHAGLEQETEVVESEDIGWQPPVLQTTAFDGGGVPEVVAAIERHHEYLQAHGVGAMREFERAAARVRELLAAILAAKAQEKSAQAGQWDSLIARVARRELDPFSAATLVAQALSV